MRFSLLAPAVAILVSSIATFANAEMLDCAIRPFDNKKWVFQKLVIILTSDHKKVQVIDPLVLAVYDHPIDGIVAEDKPTRLRVTWRVDGAGASNRSLPGSYDEISVNYTAIYNPATGRINVSAHLGNPTPSKGQGHCKVVK